MIEDLPALTYDSNGYLPSPPFHEDRLSSMSSQYSLASQALTNTGSLVSSPKVPRTPENAANYAHMFTNKVDPPHLFNSNGGLDSTFNRQEDLQLDTYPDRCGMTNYDMTNYNTIWDDCWRLRSIPEAQSYPSTLSASSNAEFAMFDSMTLNANGSLPAENGPLDFDPQALDVATQRNNLGIFLPYSSCLDGATETKPLDFSNKNQKVLRSQKPRCREEKIKFRQETTASKFPAYNDVKEVFICSAANELSRRGEMKTESSTSSPRLPLSSSLCTKTTRARRRNQTASNKITLPSENLEVEFVSKKATEKTYCPDCNKGYTRPEHMRRHKNSGHLGLDRVSCYIDTCNTVVKRKDNLIQHLSTHVRVNEKGSRQPEKIIPIEEMRSLIREKGGKNAEHMVKRLEAARLKMKMKDFLEMYGYTEGINGTKVGRSIRDHKILSKL